MTEPLRKTILISGGSGLIGASLVRLFSRERIQTIRLTRQETARDKTDDPGTIRWNPDAPEPVADLSRLENLGAAIHLSGASLSAHRWTDVYKREIVDSRVKSTRALVGLLKNLKKPPQSFLCASAVGIYGDRGDEILTESSPPGEGFLADICRAWESEADAAATASLRVVHLRFGVVLSKGGGALKQMLPIFRLGLGGRLGTGRQWMSWIAINDLSRAVLHILDQDSLKGPVNLTAPIPVTNADFTRALGMVLHRPSIIPAPRFALEAAFGEMADDALLASTRAIPERLATSGFRFEHAEIGAALKSLL